ncbi:MAG: thiamine phosphate synthase [Actinomycetota bacterium]|nr:MAG: thiamine phosphate synthase [Actinomycetota bacterium]
MPGPRDRDERAARLADSVLYLCTDARQATGDLPEFLDAVLAGGVDIVQLRQKGMEARDELAALATVTAACSRHQALVAVNDRADLAVAAAADVLHLGQDDLPVPVARRIVGEAMLVGRSSHAWHESAEALREPAVDYVAVGPCWPTPTKPGRPAPGLPLVRQVAAADPARPWFAIGGVDESTLGAVLDAGARRAVVVRALTEAADPYAAARELSSRLRAAAGQD